MFNSMRDRGDRDRLQETLDAYLDNALTPAERARFEAQMAADPRLRTEVEQLRALRMQMRAMPRRRVPRSFALDPAAYARPKAQPLLQLYPVLRGATALSAFLLIFVLALGVFQGQFGGVGAPAPEAAAVTSATVTSATAQDSAEISAIEAPQEAPAEESAAMTTDEAARTASPEATPAAEEAAAAALAAPAPEGTPVPAPEGDLSLGAPPPEATLLPNAGGAIAEAELAPTLTAAPTMATFAVQEAANAPAPEAAEPPASLLPWQIGLGVLFLVLLVLWLLARRRSRSL
ncbi:MAG: zf-HC2 domain-containing protein [Anaerolineae bacterium]|nr:zf-HC2 domain-containing protein [Anaerolineae bacterium]